MNVDYGCSQPKQRLTTIISLYGTCGPCHDNTVDGHFKLVGDQDICSPNSVTVTPTNRPFWMSEEEQLRTRHNVRENIPE